MIEFDVELVGLDANGIDLQTRGSIHDHQLALAFLLGHGPLCDVAAAAAQQRSRHRIDRTRPPEYKFVSFHGLIEHRIPQFGGPREFGMGLVGPQEIGRWIDDAMVRASIGRAFATTTKKKETFSKETEVRNNHDYL